MPNDNLPRRHVQPSARRITRNLEPLTVRRPRVRPHRKFPRTLQAWRENIFPRPVSIIVERDTLVSVRFLTDQEINGIASPDETQLELQVDPAPSPRSA